MKIKTPLHTDHQLDQLAGQFEHWRQTRSHRGERIPQALWDQAVALARVLPSQPCGPAFAGLAKRPEKADGACRLTRRGVAPQPRLCRSATCHLPGLSRRRPSRSSCNAPMAPGCACASPRPPAAVTASVRTFLEAR